MDIEKLKAEFEQSECFKRLEHVAQYTFFEFGAYIKRTDVPADIEKKCGKLITALLFSWSAWKEAKSQAKAQAIPDGFVVVPKEPTQNIYRTFYDAFNSADTGNTAQNFKAAYKAMIEAQEQANDS